MEYLNAFIDTVTSNPIYLVIAVLGVLMVLVSLAKRLFKVALILLLVLAGYVGYLAYQGKDPESVIKEKVEELKDKDLDKVKDAADDVGDKLKN